MLLTPRLAACGLATQSFEAPALRCGKLVSSSSRGPRTGEVKRRLAELGVNTDSVFERSEMLRLLEVAEARAAEAPAEVLPPVGSMDLQGLMNELEDRGIDFDVLAPEPALVSLLHKARKADHRAAPRRQPAAYSPPATYAPAQSTAPARPPPSPPQPAPSPPPPPAPSSAPPSAAPAAATSAPAAATAPSEAPAQRTTRGASPHRDLSSLVGEAVTSAVDVASGVAEKMAPAVGGVIDELTPAAQAAAATATATASSGVQKLPRGVVQRVRGWLQKVHPPPKPVLLLLCVAALRYGLVRTALAATAAKLTLDIGREMVAAGRERLRWRRGGTAGEEGAADDGVAGSVTS